MVFARAVCVISGESGAGPENRVLVNPLDQTVSITALVSNNA